MKKFTVTLVLSLFTLLQCFPPHPALAAVNTYYVAKTGKDTNPGTVSQPWLTIKKATSTVIAGDTVYVRGGVYNETVEIKVSGSQLGGYITFQNYPGETAILDGGGSSTASVGNWAPAIRIVNRSYVIIKGFEIRNYRTSGNVIIPMGILISGTANHIQLRDNVIHDLGSSYTGSGGGKAHGIEIYGDSSTQAISGIIVDNNELYNLALGSSEALVVNGNVDGFEITNNRIHDVNNIAIDILGFWGASSDPAKDQARNGIVRGNTIYNVTIYGSPAYNGVRNASCIYVDGGKDILIEKNNIHHCDIGILMSSENSGKMTSNVTVQNNLVYRNRQVGIGIGGYAANKGGSLNNKIFNNTLYNNTTQGDWGGEFYIQYNSTNNIFTNNIVYNSIGKYITNWMLQSGNSANYNLYFSTAGTTTGTWVWNNAQYSSFASYKLATGNDTNSFVGMDPLFINANADNFQLSMNSPAVNAGNNANCPVEDKNGVSRLPYAPCDIGSYEFITSTASTFSDVPSSHWANSWVERLYKFGVTSGCSASPMLYCPDTSATRAQMAIFILRSKHNTAGSSYTPPAATGKVFTDVPLGSFADAWIEQLFAEGITTGCGSGKYCPNANVTRAEMAIFLLRGKYGAAYTPPAVGTSTGFADVSITSFAAAWIKQLALEGITTGCGGGNYCPGNPVTRAEMAVFLVRTFGLP